MWRSFNVSRVLRACGWLSFVAVARRAPTASAFSVVPSRRAFADARVSAAGARRSSDDDDDEERDATRSGATPVSNSLDFDTLEKGVPLACAVIAGQALYDAYGLVAGLASPEGGPPEDYVGILLDLLFLAFGVQGIMGNLRPED